MSDVFNAKRGMLTHQVAELLGMSHPGVVYLANQGKLKHIRIGGPVGVRLFDPDDVRRYAKVRAKRSRQQSANNAKRKEIVENVN